MTGPMRSVLVMIAVSAVALASLAPTSAQSNGLDVSATLRLLDAVQPSPGIERGSSPGREFRSASVGSPAGEPFAAERLETPRPLPTPGGVTISAVIEAIPTPVPTPAPTPVPTPRPTAAQPAPAAAPASPTGNTVSGRASWYCHRVGTCPYGWTPDDAFVALPGALGGAGGRGIVGWVTVCADRCATLPVVDYCNCYWGTADQRVADLSARAWGLVSDAPLSRGLINVTLHLGG